MSRHKMDKLYLTDQLTKISTERKKRCDALYQANLSLNIAKDRELTKKEELWDAALIVGKNEFERDISFKKQATKEVQLVLTCNLELAKEICENAKTNIDWEQITEQIKIEALV